MGWSCGIVGLPNVGKSTLFNALTATAQAQVANYPFTTIEPNVAQLAVPDERLERVAALARSAAMVPTQLGFVDIAGLVKGSAKGHGLGNKFLSHIREVDAILHVLRCFEGSGVAHVEGAIDPVRDADAVETELILADLEHLERRAEGLRKRAHAQDADAIQTLAAIERVRQGLEKGAPARRMSLAGVDPAHLGDLQLLTLKPLLYVCNVDEHSIAGNAHSQRLEARAKAEGTECLTISAEIEAEIAQLPTNEERQEFLKSLGLRESGLKRVIRACYRLLDLVTFFTANAKEAHAWTLPRGAKAFEAAGAVHTDFARGFIRAEVIGYEEYVASGGEAGAKETGLLKTEGKDYVVRDGDILFFRFQV
jgi:GTP-binding protein YchF